LIQEQETLGIVPLFWNDEELADDGAAILPRYRRLEWAMQILQGHKDIVLDLAFSPDGAMLASASKDGTVRLWHFPTGTPGAVLQGLQAASLCLAFSPDGRWLALTGFHFGLVPAAAAWVWDLTDPHRRIELPVSGNSPNVYQWPIALAFTPECSQLVLTGYRRSGWNGQSFTEELALLRRWQVRGWAELPAADFELQAASGGIFARWALDLRLALLATPALLQPDRSVVIWDLQTTTERFRVAGYAEAMNFSPDGRRFAVGGNSALAVYDIAEQKPIASWKHPGRRKVQSLAFSPDGRTLATVSNDTAARFWQADTGREKTAYGWDIGPLKAVAFAPDGLRAAASGKKGTIVVWDVD